MYGAAVLNPRTDARLMAEHENQHTVPEFHLRQFLHDAGQQVLWQYSKSDPSRPRWVSPRDASAESYFYSAQCKDGTWDLALEKASGNIERETAPAIKRLILNQQLGDNDRELIASYIGLMFMRTRGPRDNAASYVDELQSPQFVVELLDRHWKLFCSEFGEAEVSKLYSSALSQLKLRVEASPQSTRYLFAAEPLTYSAVVPRQP